MMKFPKYQGQSYKGDKMKLERSEDREMRGLIMYTLLPSLTADWFLLSLYCSFNFIYYNYTVESLNTATSYPHVSQA